jgi:hypothetical protein
VPSAMSRAASTTRSGRRGPHSAIVWCAVDGSRVIDFFHVDELEDGNLYALAALRSEFRALWPDEEVALAWSGDTMRGTGTTYE